MDGFQNLAVSFEMYTNLKTGSQFEWQEALGGVRDGIGCT